MSRFHRLLPFATLAFAIAALYLFNLDGVGVLQTDEPRYLAIGHAMFQTHDFVTPKLWGSPWFEKPPLLYWLTALGASFRLGPEVSGRLPVALLSLAFLWATYVLLSREFGAQSAAIATALLATSAGWLAYSELALTDLPLSAFFALAVLLALPLLRDSPQTRRLTTRFALIGVCLGIASLAKGLVPFVLALPFLWFLRSLWRYWWAAFVAGAAIALPWYIAVYIRNGFPFIQEFFLKHHFERLYSATLQHVQPWYYYFPVLLAGLFPWTPLFFYLLKKTVPWDQRRVYLATLVVFGFLFFSVSLNKLPGYLLPLFPAAFALLGAEFETKPIVQVSRWWLLPCACLIAIIPLLVSVLPDSLAGGRINAVEFQISPTEGFYILLPVVALILARRSWAGTVLVLCLVAGGIYLKVRSFPVLDQMASPRGLWREVRNNSMSLCDAGTNREWIYGLEFYLGSPLPACTPGQHFAYEIRSIGRAKPVVTPSAP
ncbi:MAG: phospholipid carrier-dependent glycosyltransferase [Acidobacteriaceae bacterium]|nr:phospholipid carrier-dependent glycosyltransferase [Acidobacteriaceae bacterium]